MVATVSGWACITSREVAREDAREDAREVARVSGWACSSPVGHHAPCVTTRWLVRDPQL